MTKDKIIIKELKLGFHVPVEDKGEKVCIFSPFKDDNGNYRDSGWWDSLEEAKQYIGNLCGYTQKELKELKEESKDYTILTPFKLKPEETLQVGDKVRILDTIKETDDWGKYKDYFPDMRGKIDTICNDHDGLMYEVEGENNCWNISADYLIPETMKKKKKKKTS